MNDPSTQSGLRKKTRVLIALTAMTGLIGTLGANSGEDDQIQLILGPDALYEPGTQPETDINLFKPILSATDCSYWHAEFIDATSP